MSDTSEGSQQHRRGHVPPKAHRILLCLFPLFLAIYVVAFAYVPSSRKPSPLPPAGLYPAETIDSQNRDGARTKRLVFGGVLVALSAVLAYSSVHPSPSVAARFPVSSRAVPRAGEDGSGWVLRAAMTVIEETGDGVIITDESGRIEYANPAFQKMSGYAPDELRGQNARILKSGQHDREFYEAFAGVIRSGKTWRGKLVNKRKDGSFYHEHMIVRPVRCEEDGATRFVAVKRDLTDRVIMEERLRQSQKMQTIGELAGGIAHDFNNLLTVILGNCNLLVFGNDDLGDTVRENVQEIMNAADRATSLTRRLLAFSRKQAYQPEILDLSQVLENLRKMLKRLIPENIGVTIKTVPYGVYVRADEVMVEQIIINLAVNARDAMPQGGRLTVGVGRREVHPKDQVGELKAGHYAILTVQDTGLGMDEEIQAHMFERFFTTKGDGHGTGLGLATVQEIVTQEGGCITVRSAPDQGTFFTVYLPLLVEVKHDPVLAQPAPGASPARPEKPAARVDGGCSGTILVVDDEASVLRMIERALKAAGYNVLAALNDEEVFALWRQHQEEVDLLLTDVVMPGKSGVEVAACLREDRADLKVLCMSAYTDKVITKLGGSGSGIRFLQKPFTQDVLAAAVLEALSGVEGEGQVTSEL